MPSVVIAGGGIIGLATALELAGAGCDVTVLEQGRAMEGSSWAAAGMLAVHDPENPPALLPLSLLSEALYPEFLQRVEGLSGLAVPFRTVETLQGARRGRPHAPPVLPELASGEYSFSPLRERSLDPRDLCRALPLAAVAAGATLREQETARAVEHGASGVQVLLATGEVLEANHFILTGGAWSGLLRLPHAPELPIAPRKGQVIEVTLAGPALPVAIRTPELYLVPRGDGRIVVGATVEHAGFDRTVDVAAGDRLWQAAAELWPPILKGQVTARWTGLRPGFAVGVGDTLPVIGPIGENVFIAAGHFRNGILLAPGTARILRETLLGQTLSVSLVPLDPRRFSAALSVVR